MILMNTGGIVHKVSQFYDKLCTAKFERVQSCCEKKFSLRRTESDLLSSPTLSHIVPPVVLLLQCSQSYMPKCQSQI